MPPRKAFIVAAQPKGWAAIATDAPSWPAVVAFGLVWLAHIGMDRAFGYGLKYDDHFQHTHLGRLG